MRVKKEKLKRTFHNNITFEVEDTSKLWQYIYPPKEIEAEREYYRGIVEILDSKFKHNTKLYTEKTSYLDEELNWIFAMNRVLEVGIKKGYDFNNPPKELMWEEVESFEDNRPMHKVQEKVNDVFFYHEVDSDIKDRGILLLNGDIVEIPTKEEKEELRKKRVIYWDKDGLNISKYTATEEEGRRCCIERSEVYVGNYISFPSGVAVEDSYVYWMVAMELLLQLGDECGFDFHNPSKDCYVNIRKDLEGKFIVRDRKELEHISFIYREKCIVKNSSQTFSLA